MTDTPLQISSEMDGKVLKLRLARPKANIVDAEMIAALDEAFQNLESAPALRAVVLCHEGSHFSFGASVEEHMPTSCAAMLASLHGLVKRMLNCPIPILVAVRGQCLGGGLELALAGDLIFSSPDARLGQPEIKLAVFAPAASCLLPERVSRCHANDLLLSGRSVTGEDAKAMNLVFDLSDDPEAAASKYIEEHLADSSASSLRYAVQAARGDMVARVEARLDEVEALYLNEMMKTYDAVEGLTAFLEKRPASWEA